MANQGAADMFGYSRVELLNQPLSLLIPKDCRPNHGGFVNNFANSKKQNKLMQSGKTIYALSSSGKRFPIETTLSKTKIGHKFYFNAIIRNIEDRVEKEVKLLKSEQKFKGIFNSIIDVFTRTNNDGIIEIISPSVYDILGYTPEELIGKKSIHFYVNPSDRKKLVQQIKKHGVSSNFKVPIFNKKGQKKIVLINSKVYTDKAGNLLGIESILRDITEEEKNKQALKDSNIEFRNLFENALDEIYLVNSTTMKILNLNKTACNHLGYTKDELIGRKLLKIVPLIDLSKNALRMFNVLKGKTETFYSRHKRKNGTLYPIEIKIKGIQYKGQKVFLGMVRDISDRKKIETELLESQQQLLSINDNTPDLIVTVNKDWKVTYINRVLAGFNLEDVLNSNVLTFVPETFHEQYKEHLKKAFNNEKQEFELEAYGEGEKKAWYSVRTSTLNQNSQNDSLLIISTDITERKKTALYNSITNSISHKLNSNISFNDFCQYIFLELQKIKPFPNVYISSYNKTNDRISFPFLTKNGELQTNLPPSRVKGKGLTEHIIKTKKGLLLIDKDLKKFHKKHGLKIYGEAAKTWLGVPLLSDNETVGVLATQCLKEEAAYTSSDLELFSFIGTQIGYLLGKNRAEKEIKQFEKYFSVSMDLLCIAGTDGFFKKINPKFSEILGYSEEELLSTSFMDFIHPEDIEATSKEIESLSKKNPTINFLNRYRCKNGEYKYFLWTGSTDPTSDKIYAAARDITEQIKSQQILAALSDIQNNFIEDSTAKKSFENMLSTLLEVTQSEYGFIGEVLYKDDKPYLKTHAITNISWNKETASFYKKNAPKGLEFHNMKTLFGQVITTGKAVISNNPYQDPRRGGLPPGHPHMESFLGLPFYHDTNLIGMIGIANKPNGYSEKDISILEPFLTTCSTLIKAFQNITKRQQAEKKVHKLASIVSHSSDAIISTNQEGKVISWNIGAEKLLGYTSKEILNTSVIKLRPEILKEEHDKIVLDIKSGKSIKSYDTLQVNKNGTLVPVNMSIFPIIDKKGNLKGISSILRDISSQKEAELIKEEFTKRLELKVNERTKELKESQKKLALSLEKEKDLGELKSRFVAIASHQFRTPLTVIQSSMGVLALQSDDMNDKFSSKFERVYNRIERQIEKMTSLMNQVLILGKINTLNVQPTFKSTDLIAFCEEIMANHNAIQIDGRSLIFTVHGDAYKIKLDAKLMEDAISNLISNAFKYSANKPAPSLTISFGKQEVQLSIKDNGIGIPSQDVKYLFNPFFRASNVTGLSGTGLGTAIAKEYVELNGGTISVTSKLNKGSEFIITLKKT